jgi:hypothetical protein
MHAAGLTARLGLAAIFVALAGTAALPATIKQSPVCKAAGGSCVSFDADTPISDVASFAFAAPSAGTAFVMFNGLMTCLNESLTAASNRGVVDLTTQIMTGNGSPNYQGPGGARFSFRLPPAPFLEASVPVNLATSRVVALARGRHTFTYRITKNRMDLLTGCIIFNGNFSVVFVP